MPVSIWAVRNLSKDNPKLPLVLLPYAIETFLTTLVCIVEYLTWDITGAQKVGLSTLYGPYLVLSIFMLADMYLRLNARIQGPMEVAKVREKKGL